MIKNFLQKKFINWLVKDLFNSITKDDILQIVQTGTKKVMLYRGKRLDEATILKLKDEAERLVNSTLWKCLSDEVKYVSNLRMFEKSQTTDDILAGKLALYILEVFERKLKEISEI